MTGRYMREVFVSGLGAGMGQALLSLPVLEEQAALHEVSRRQAKKQTEGDGSSHNRQ